MKSKIVGTIMLGGVLGFIAPVAGADECLILTADYGSCGTADTFACWAGSNSFRFQLQRLIDGAQAINEEGVCLGAHITIAPDSDDSCSERGLQRCRLLN